MFTLVDFLFIFETIDSMNSFFDEIVVLRNAPDSEKNTKEWKTKWNELIRESEKLKEEYQLKKN